MESERPHRTTSTNSSSTSELFICFTSRLSSSSSMKLSSKSILSPGRTRESSQISLSSSLSRRLRSNGSMKGGQASPMFPTGGKKRGCAFENPEPSSPKVTCIGQVRVKTKKQGKKLRTRSKRRGEVSFRRVEQQTGSNASHQELNMQNSNPNGQFSSHQILQHQQQEGLPHRNQKWVHLPLTICEALRAFGAEFNCFLPCRSSCMTSEREKEEKAARSDGESGGNGTSCGAVFARWLVALQEGEGKGREIELVVGEEERVTERSESLRRREIFEGIEIKEEEEERNEVVEEEEARVSVCVPPKNALLLMRCRSDPVKMAALANRFWESPVRKDEDVVEDDEEEEDDEDEEQGDLEVGYEERQRKVEEEEDGICEKWVSDGEDEQANLVMEEEEEEDVQENPERIPEVLNEVLQEHPEEQEEEETVLTNGSSPEVFLDPENSEMEQNVPKLVQENEDSQESEPQAEPEEEIEEEEDGDKGARFSTSLVSVQSEQESHSQEEEEAAAAKVEALEENETKAEALEEEEKEAASELAAEKATAERAWEDEEKVTRESSKPENPKQQTGRESKIRESQQGKVSVLPDCLLLMMCEPKLSMEVSKETWVCSTDFIRWLPERPPVKKTDGGDELKKRNSTDSKPAHKAPQVLQPPRSSCSYPAAPGAAGAASMATMIEQKLVGAKGYEPFVLKRCKSEPMRSAAKLAPDACFWKNRKLEPHRPTTLGVGAAGVGC